jgi:hypothetical protein
MDLIMYYFIGSELGVANFLQRHFDWASNALWYEEIPNARDPSKSMFVLGGQDSIIKSEVSEPYCHVLFRHRSLPSVCCDTLGPTE